MTTEAEPGRTYRVTTVSHHGHDHMRCAEYAGKEEDQAMTKWWAARLDVSDVRGALRQMIDEGNDDAREALEALRRRRGRLNYVEASNNTGYLPVAASLAEAGARVLLRRIEGE